MSKLRAGEAAPFVEGCVPGEPLQAEQFDTGLPAAMQAHLDLITEKLNRQLAEHGLCDCRWEYGTGGGVDGPRASDTGR